MNPLVITADEVAPARTVDKYLALYRIGDNRWMTYGRLQNTAAEAADQARYQPEGTTWVVVRIPGLQINLPPNNQTE